MDPIKKKVTKEVTGAALQAAKKRAQKNATKPAAAASKALGEGKSVTAADVARAAKPSGRGNPAARKLGRGQRPQPADIAKSKAKNAEQAAASLKSKAAQKGGSARQATGNKSSTSGKFEKGQKKAPLTKTEKAGIAGATVGTAAFLGKDRAPDQAPMAARGPSTEDKIAAEKRRYEARKQAALARAKAQSDYYKKKSSPSNKGYLTDSEGKRVKSGSGEDIRTRYKCGGEVMKKATGGEAKLAQAKKLKSMTPEQRMDMYKKEKERAKPGQKRVKYKNGGAVKGCGVAKRGLGKAMKK